MAVMPEHYDEQSGFYVALDSDLLHWGVALCVGIKPSHIHIAIHFGPLFFELGKEL